MSYEANINPFRRLERLGVRNELAVDRSDIYFRKFNLIFERSKSFVMFDSEYDLNS